MLVLSFFFGNLGLHRFYAKKPITAVLMLITIGGFGFWWLVDVVTIALGRFKEKNGQFIRI